MVQVRALALALAAVLAAAPAVARAQGQGPAPQAAVEPAGSAALSNAGVLRASRTVDSVFLDRTSDLGVVAGGDWVSYLLARLGVQPIQEGLTVRVAVDTARIVLTGQLRDLPPATRGDLGPLLAMMDSTSTLAAEVEMSRPVPGVVRFRLAGAALNGMPIPDMIVQPVMAQIAQRYPVLSAGGRELLVQIPPQGKVELVPGAVRLSHPR